MNAYIFKSRIRLALVLFVAVGLSRVAFATPETRVGACEIARGYITLVNEGRYSEISALFSENALYLPPTGEIINGRDAIHDFYERFLSALRRASVSATSPNRGRIALSSWKPWIRTARTVTR